MSEPLDLDAIRTRVEAASPGPWIAATNTRRRDGVALVGVKDHAVAVFAATDVQQRQLDAEFTAAARTDVPALLAEIERLRTLVRHVEHYGTGYVWHSPDGDKVLHPADVSVVPANQDSELELLRNLAEKVRAWRRARDFTYRPGEINPHLLTAHHEDLDLAAAVDRLYPPDSEP